MDQPWSVPDQLRGKRSMLLGLYAGHSFWVVGAHNASTEGKARYQSMFSEAANMHSGLRGSEAWWHDTWQPRTAMTVHIDRDFA